MGQLQNDNQRYHQGASHEGTVSFLFLQRERVHLCGGQPTLWSDSIGSGREEDSCRDWPQRLAATLNPMHICTHTPPPPSSCTCCVSVEGWRDKTAERWMNQIQWNELAPPGVQSYLSVWSLHGFRVFVQVYCSYFILFCRLETL